MKAARRAPAFCQLEAVAEAAWGSGDAHVPSVTTRHSRPQVVGARGAPHLPLGFAPKPSLSAPWARGLLSAFWERGSPDLPACGPRRGSSNGLVRPIFTSKHSRPSRGAKPCEAGNKDLLRGSLTRLAREEQRDQCEGHLVRFP